MILITKLQNNYTNTNKGLNLFLDLYLESLTKKNGFNTE